VLHIFSMDVIGTMGGLYEERWLCQ
jgi:hypothetical protein